MIKRYIGISLIGILLATSDVYATHLSCNNGKFRTEESNFVLVDHTIQVVDDYGKPLQGVKIYTVDQSEIGETDEEGKISLASQQTYLLKHPLFYTIQLNHVTTDRVAMKSKMMGTKDTLTVVYDNLVKDQALGAISVLYNNQLKTSANALYLNALTGRIAGLHTQEVSGFRSARTAAITAQDLAGSLPTDATKYSTNMNDNSEVAFNLRGQSPVILIDGVQRDIFSIDPESIESISVAKDALSSILLGQRSSRGVLQVITKKGQIGAPRISFTAQTGIQESLNLPKPLDAYQYAYLYNEALLNAGRQPVFSQGDFDAYKNGTDPLQFPNVNWYNQTLKNNNPISKYNLSVNGGIKNARYALSLSYLNQLGMFKSSDEFAYETNLQNQRYLINSSIDVDVTEDFTIGLQFFGKIQDGRQPGAGTQRILESLYQTPNNAYPIVNPDGSYGGSSVYTRNLFQQVTGSGYLLDNNRDLLTNLDFHYKLDQFLPGLYAKGKLNVSASSSSLIDRNRQQPVYDVRYNDQNELVYVRFGTIADQPNSFATTSTANFFYFQGALGYNTIVQEDHQVSAQVFLDQRTANYQFDLPATHSNYAVTGKYAYLDKYSAELALNYSGFNRFLPGKKYGLFYAVGLGWDILKENFMEGQEDWLNKLKLRATYGRTGNTNEGSLGYYSWRSSYGQGGNNGYEFGSEYARVHSLVEKGLANVQGTWEKGDKFNLGIDASFFQNTLNLSADVYHDTYFDLLQQRGSTIDLIGIPYPNENIGKNRYQGQELNLTYQNHIGNFNYFINANASRMKTEVLYMNEVYRQYSWNKRTGMPVGQTFGYLGDGLIQTQSEANNAPKLAGNEVHPGDVKLIDLNGDGIIDQHDQTAIGNRKPTIFLGTTLGFSVQGFDFSVLLQAVLNRTYQQTDYSFGSNGESQGFDYLLGRWTPETAATATYPRLTIGSDPTNTPFLNNSSFWTRSGEYLRIRNLDVGYTLPFSLTSKMKIAGIRVFANAQNLFTITPYKRLDPEINAGTAYPAQRIYNFGINIKL
ncbi:SusC/RagA family TonB-linked outer membrane protein [Sphingobacterium sp. HJSM2_6]|uniref:SusC/RagA family TonB-linked outer membrane protein n=1 Tax=Sphingobacterium sp. HJSM2_6 TaxID=3366264 RepID=UPI003BBE1E6F